MPADTPRMASLLRRRSTTECIRRGILVASSVTLLATALTTLLPQSVAEAGTHYAYSSQKYVAKVLDGDTIEVYRNGKSGARDTIRFAAINTNEIDPNPNNSMCHGESAKTRMKDLIEGKWVTLLAQDPNSRASDGVRYLRFVEYEGVDLNLLMLQESYAFAMPSKREPSRNERYMSASRLAATAGERLWDDDFCGAGPSAAAEFRMIVHWDAAGEDGTPGTLNGEWVRIFNDSTKSVPLHGWQLRSASTHNIWSFPSSAAIPAGGYVTVHVGTGTNTATKFYMNLNDAVFDNNVGDGAYLLDPDDDIRAHFEYPCIDHCRDPLQGALRLSVNADAVGHDADHPNGEWVNIQNISQHSVNLRGYLLRNGGKLYEFPGNSRIAPGERMRVYIGSGSESRLEKHWGYNRGILSEDDWVRIETYDGIQVAEFEWRCNPCGPVDDVYISAWREDVPGGNDTANDEWIEITNRSGHDVDLRDWELADNVNRLDFDVSRTLGAGDTLRVYVGHGTDTADKMYWGLGGQILFSNDLIQLHTPNDDLVSCVHWGDKHCDPVVQPTFCKGELVTVVGTDHKDHLYGTAGHDVFLALDGNDTITPLGGDDTICGGAGRDTIDFSESESGVTVDLRAGTSFGEGSDKLLDIENIIGSPASDKLVGNSDRNKFDGGRGRDRLIGRGGKDKLSGGPGRDTIKGGSRSDVIFGQAGNDDLIGGAGSSDTLDGGAGNDHCDPNGGIAMECES